MGNIYISKIKYVWFLKEIVNVNMKFLLLFIFQILKHYDYSFRYSFKYFFYIIVIAFQNIHLEVQIPCVLHINIFTAPVNVTCFANSHTF